MPPVPPPAASPPVRQGHPSSGPIGPAGPAARAERITFRRIFADAWRRLVELDSLSLRTVARLATRPSRVIVPYIAGERGAATNPVQIYFITGALVILVSKLLTPHRADVWRAGAAGGSAPEIAARISEWYLDASAVIGVLTAPVLAAATRVLFPSRGYNLAEHTVFALYAFVPAMLISVLVLPFGGVLGPGATLAVSVLLLFVSVVYTAWDVFGENVFVTAMKTAAAMTLYGVALLGVSIAGAIVAAVILVLLR